MMNKFLRFILSFKKKMDRYFFTLLYKFKNTFITYLIPFFLSVVITKLFYPGAMSYDTLHALRSARNGVSDSIWPPMVSYIWRFVDLFSTNPSAMHFVQITLLIVALFTILHNWTKNIIISTKYLVVYLSVPTILGTLAVIWKDVLMASFFLVGFTLTLLAKNAVKNSLFIMLLFTSILTTFLGTCSRHNALAGAIPLIYFQAYVFYTRFLSPKSQFNKMITVLAIGTLLVSIVFSSKLILDNYSLPKFVKIKNETHLFIEYVRVFDVAAASLCVGKNLFGEMAPNLTLSDIKNGYDPRHINFSLAILDMVKVDSRINKIWIKNAINHPICILKNKFDLTLYLLGLNKGNQFIITHPIIDKNEFGYTFTESRARDAAFDYIVTASELFFLRPWFLYSLTLLSFFYLIYTRSMNIEYITIFMSGALYLLSLILFGNAADARLTFYTTTTFLSFLFITFFNFFQKK